MTGPTLGAAIAGALLAGFAVIVLGVVYGGAWRIAGVVVTGAFIGAIALPVVMNNKNGENK